MERIGQSENHLTSKSNPKCGVKKQRNWGEICIESPRCRRLLSCSSRVLPSLADARHEDQPSEPTLRRVQHKRDGVTIVCHQNSQIIRITSFYLVLAAIDHASLPKITWLFAKTLDLKAGASRFARSSVRDVRMQIPSSI